MAYAYGEGEDFNEDTNLVQRYPTLPASTGLEGFRPHCFIWQPAVVFRRSMRVLLGEFDQQWSTAFDYWLRALEAFPHRILYLPHLQVRTRLHSDTITTRQRAQVALITTTLLRATSALQMPNVFTTKRWSCHSELQRGQKVSTWLPVCSNCLRQHALL